MNWKSLLLLTLSTVSVWGSVPILYSSTAMTPAIAQNTSKKAKYQTFVSPKNYSISYPQGWFVRKVSEDLTYITNRQLGGAGEFPDGFIKTDVEIINEKYQNVLTQALSSPKEDHSRILKKQNVKVDGKNAIRIWATTRDGEMLLTLLPYKKNQTVSIATFYTKVDSNNTQVMERLHSSFKSLN